jgi:hypothetical protein
VDLRPVIALVSAAEIRAGTGLAGPPLTKLGWEEPNTGLEIRQVRASKSIHARDCNWRD